MKIDNVQYANRDKYRQKGFVTSKNIDIIHEEKYIGIERPPFFFIHYGVFFRPIYVWSPLVDLVKSEELLHFVCNFTNEILI